MSTDIQAELLKEGGIRIQDANAKAAAWACPGGRHGSWGPEKHRLGDFKSCWGRGDAGLAGAGCEFLWRSTGPGPAGFDGRAAA
jgi:hypothetical protein